MGKYKKALKKEFKWLKKDIKTMNDILEGKKEVKGVPEIYIRSRRDCDIRELIRLEDNIRKCK